MPNYDWDLFICHAWEDKETLVRPLAELLRSLGLNVWYDEFTLRIGDSLFRSIDQGLAKSRYGLVVISKALFTKEIPQHELRGLLTRQLHEGRKVLLPIWHGVTKEEVLAFSPPLTDPIALRTADMGAEDIGLQIFAEVRPDLYAQYERADLLQLYKTRPLHELHEELLRLREHLSEFQCPHCGALMSEHVSVSIDDCDVDRKVYECGYETDGGWVDRPCPHSHDVPDFSEYEIKYENDGDHWTALGTPRTDRARRFGVLYPMVAGGRMGREHAAEVLYETYLRQFKYHEWKTQRKHLP